jgi:hypothetical protein
MTVVKERTRRTTRSQVILPSSIAPQTNVCKNTPCADDPKALGSVEQAFVYDGERRSAMTAESDVQHPIVQAHEGGNSEAGKRWDAHAEYDVGVLIASYLQQNPAPQGSRVELDLALAARNLRAAGQLRLDCLGHSHLQVVASPGYPISE